MKRILGAMLVVFMVVGVSGCEYEWAKQFIPTPACENCCDDGLCIPFSDELDDLFD